jgi:hypothetical protein
VAKIKLKIAIKARIVITSRKTAKAMTDDRIKLVQTRRKKPKESAR